MKKILLIGNGAREHVIAETLKRSPQGVSLVTYAKARNPGIAALSDVYEIGDYKDFDHVRKFAFAQKPDFAFLGPDDPIADGVADLLLEEEIHSVAPLKTVARLESSKAFTRDLVTKYKIPGNPKYRVFHSMEGVHDFLEELHGEYVVKADVLMGGKGVKVAGDHLKTVDEGLKYAEECIRVNGRVVIEEKLHGQEFSLMSFCDGKFTVDMPVVQDHKRAFVGDTGPNTGGMGSYSDADHLLPFLRTEDVDEARLITKMVAEALEKETGAQYKGIMYGGFIAVRNGVKLIEFNARFGDPEAMNVLPLLQTDFVEICEGIIHGNLKDVFVDFAEKATVCKYVVPEGYPDHPKKGEKITVGKVPEGVRMYYASVDEREGELYMSSSRALAFVGIADTIQEAEAKAEAGVHSVSGPIFYRPDIGTSALIEKRIALMKLIHGKEKVNWSK